LGPFANWTKINAWINLDHWIYIKIITNLLFNVSLYLGRQIKLRLVLSGLKAQMHPLLLLIHWCHWISLEFTQPRQDSCLWQIEGSDSSLYLALADFFRSPLRLTLLSQESCTKIVSALLLSASLRFVRISFPMIGVADRRSVGGIRIAWTQGVQRWSSWAHPSSGLLQGSVPFWAPGTDSVWSDFDCYLQCLIV
jgi:hypothetical protein